MKRSSISRALALAAALGFAAGMAEAADTFNTPQIAGEVSTMTNGQPNVQTQNGAPVYYYRYVPSTAVLGAGPVVVYSTPYIVYPSAQHGGASETSNVPLRAGEMSTMTNGAPNLFTTNNY